MNKKFLVIDLETDSLDIKKANIIWIGIYDGKEFNIMKYNKENKLKLIEMIKNFETILTYNGNNFDIPILKRHGILSNKDFYKEKFLYKGIDIYEVIKKRATLLFPEGFKSLSLDAVSDKLFNNNSFKKLKINYDIFKKENLTKEEIKQIKNYVRQDLLLTWKVWEFLVKKFKPFACFLNSIDVAKLYHIKASSATFGYKAVCHRAGIEEKWANSTIKPNKFDGAYVMQPTKENSKGEILYLDFASLYPMIYIHNNLFSFNCNCCKKEEKWHGNEKWKLNGYYCSKQQGKIENVLKEFYLLRKEYKKNKDSREQAIKIILNSLYGSSSKPAFKQIYSLTTASDCTLLGQQIIKHSINEIEKNKLGCVLMSDTDSIVLEVAKNKTKKECLSFIKILSKKISNSFPFPWGEFNLKLEDDLKYIQFFKGRDGTFNKKWYLYINKDNKLILKGLDIIQKNCTKLSQKIFNEFLKEKIIKNLDCKFDKGFIDNKINTIIKQDKMIIAKRFNIKSLNNYKSQTSIYYLIGKKYKEGEIFLIKNYKTGAGKGIKYCSIEDAKNLSIDDLNLEDVYKELSVFIKNYNFKKIKKKNEQRTLI